MRRWERLLCFPLHQDLDAARLEAALLALAPAAAAPAAAADAELMVRT